MTNWLPISAVTAEDKKGPILGWCVHDDNAYEAGQDRLTLYAAHVEGMSHVEDGPNVLVWGGAWADCEEDGGGSMPDWWFLKGSEFEVAANPVLFARIADPGLLTMIPRTEPCAVETGEGTFLVAPDGTVLERLEIEGEELDD